MFALSISRLTEEGACVKHKILNTIGIVYLWLEVIQFSTIIQTNPLQ